MRRGLMFWGLAVLLVPVPSRAEDDPDGTRPRATSMPLDATRSDQLSPPEDAADWRYLQVERRSTLVVELTLEEGSTASLTVESASGETIETLESIEAGDRFEQSLDPGVYYLRVASDAKIRYTLSVAVRRADDEGESAPESSDASE